MFYWIKELRLLKYAGTFTLLNVCENEKVVIVKNVKVNGSGEDVRSSPRPLLSHGPVSCKTIIFSNGLHNVGDKHDVIK